MDVSNKGEVVNGYVGPVAGGEDAEMSVNGFGHSLIASSCAPLEEISRYGNSYMMRNYAALNNILAIPTTTAMCTWWNGSTSKSMVLDAAYWTSVVVDATQSNSHMMLFNIQPPGFAKPTASAAVATSLSGKGGFTNSATNPPGSNVLLVTGATVVDTGWLPLHTSPPSPANAGALWTTVKAEINGAIIIPPTAAFSLVELSLAAVATSSLLTLQWHEVAHVVNP